MNFSAGIFDKLYYNDYANGGTYATPTLVLVDGFEDLDASDEANIIGFKMRRYEHELYLLGTKKKDFGFSLACEPDNEQWQFLYAAYQAKTPIEIFAFYKFIPNDPDDGQPNTDSKARRCTCLISQFSPPQKLEGIDVNEVKLVLSANPVDPNDPDTPTVKEPEDYTV